MPTPSAAATTATPALCPPPATRWRWRETPFQLRRGGPHQFRLANPEIQATNSRTGPLHRHNVAGGGIREGVANLKRAPGSIKISAVAYKGIGCPFQLLEGADCRLRRQQQQPPPPPCALRPPPDGGGGKLHSNSDAEDHTNSGWRTQKSKQPTHEQVPSTAIMWRVEGSGRGWRT